MFQKYEQSVTWGLFPEVLQILIYCYLLGHLKDISRLTWLNQNGWFMFPYHSHPSDSSDSSASQKKEHHSSFSCQSKTKGIILDPSFLFLHLSQLLPVACFYFKNTVYQRPPTIYLHTPGYQASPECCYLLSENQNHQVDSLLSFLTPLQSITAEYQGDGTHQSCALNPLVTCYCSKKNKNPLL